VRISTVQKTFAPDYQGQKIFFEGNPLPFNRKQYQALFFSFMFSRLCVFPL